MIKTTKIGILGGAFNPPTIGHLQLAKAALEKTDMQDIWFMPCKNHVFNKDMIDAEKRYDMCSIMVKKELNIVVGRHEIDNDLPGDTYATLNFIKNYYIDPYFIIGGDNANNINKWKNWRKIIKEHKFIVAGRIGYTQDETKYWWKYGEHIDIGDTDIMECSSSEVRELLKDGKKVEKYIHEDVYEYIKEHKLYEVK